MSLPTILEKICGFKFEEIAQRKLLAPMEQLIEQSSGVDLPRDFVGAITEAIGRGDPAIIAEIKKASPSKGVIREDFHPVDIAKSYEAAGATCLSVLTDVAYFQGADAYLQAARSATALPALRKDFTVDAYQVYEARCLGADAILLIAAALAEEKLFELKELADSLNLSVIIEVHNQQEMETALKTGNQLIGVNNRNLHNFETSLNTTLDLLSAVGEEHTLITESGIHQRDQVDMMRREGVHGFLVGEAFMRFDDPGDGIKALFSR